MINRLALVNIGDGLIFKSPFTLDARNVSKVVTKGLEWAISLAGLILLFLLLGAGWQIISSSGSNNPEGMKKATKTATTAIVGMMVVVFAYLIVRLVEMYFFGANRPFTQPGV